MTSQPANVVQTGTPPPAGDGADRCDGAMSPLELYMLADDQPRFPRSFVVGLEFAGVINRGAFERALAESLVSEPRLTAVVERRGLFGRAWRSRPDISADVWWRSSEEELDACEILQIDLCRRPGLRVIVVETPGRTRVYHVFHHACCDGLGALAWLGRLYSAYSRATCPHVPVEASRVDVETLRDFRLTEDLPARMGSHSQARSATLRRIREELMTRPARLLPVDRGCRRLAGVGGMNFPGSVTHVFEHVQTRSLKRGAQKSRATLNDLLVSAMFRTLRDWNREIKPDADRDWYRIMAPVDLRSPQHDHLPAANLASCVFVTQPGALCADSRRLLQAVTRRMQYAVGSRSALIMYNVIRRLTLVPGLLPFALRAWRVQATALVSYVGDAGRGMQAGFPRQRGRYQIGNLELQRITATGPVRSGTAANLTAGIYAGQLVLNLSLDRQQFVPADAQRMLNMIVLRLLDYSDEGTLVASASEPPVGATAR